MKKLILVDGNSVMHACYHAIPKLTSNDGTPTSAFYGFINVIFRLMDDYPTHFAVVFDSGKSNRKELYANYKANRPPMADDLWPQFALAKKFLEILHIPVFEENGVEADDILATLSMKFRNELPVYIATRDKDLLQLCNYENIYVLLTNSTRGERVMGSKEVKELMGVTPKQILDFKALCGDTSDNIPGVPGIGKVTAIKLIKEYNSISNIVAAAFDNKLSVKLCNTIKNNIDDLILSMELAQLRIVESDVELSRLERQPADETELKEYLNKYQINIF